MAVVIRLQGLRATADALDIRKFFTGLRIPDGGVHIIGGEREEAFIIFASDEDARRAMTRSLGCIRGSPVTLLLSSKTEMQNMLERSAANVELDEQRPLENARRAERSVDPDGGRTPGSRMDHNPPPQHQGAPSKDDDLMYLFLRGMPFTVTEQEVCEFFSGLVVDDIILFTTGYGAKNGRGIVKFATSQDAFEGLKRHKEYIRSRYVEIAPATVEDWYRAGGKLPMADNVGNDFIRDRSPVRNQRSPQLRERSHSPVAQTSLAIEEEYCVVMDNLSYAVDKEDIKKLFRSANLEDGQILHLTGRDGRKSRCAFVLFRSLRDYCDALANEKRLFQNRMVTTRPISREKMITLLESQNIDDRLPGNAERFQERSPSYPNDAFDSEKLCLHVRNLPFDVRKVEIMDFFLGFNVTEDKVFVMNDRSGDGDGKAFVLFRSEAEAMRALSLNGQRFLGSEIMLKCITRSQMQQMRFEPSTMREQIVQNPPPREELYSARSSVASHRPSDTEYPDFRIPRDADPQMPYPQAPFQGGSDYEPYGVGPNAPRSRGNGFRGNFDGPVKNFDSPTCVQLLNLPFQIRREEIYDFCYGYQIIPESVSLQYDQSGRPKGSATAVFESRHEALKAVEELSGRPIGPRRIQLLLV